ncbi:hypothetical protein SEA_MARGO_5 [Mycobacterium phage Margo]|nr:hypothetical protein SEA_MARGO_5 [Mycobacterium phage Margo]
MAIRLGSVNPNAFRVGTQSPSRIFLGDKQVWPEFTEVRQQITTAGSYTFNIPAGCLFIDVILLGGGGGGQGMGSATAWGQGGWAGSWGIWTLRRGIDIPWSTTQITGVVGAGGTAGPGFSLSGTGAGGAGGNTTAVATGWAGTHVANGGAGGNNRNLDTTGKSPGTQTVNGINYVGGAEAFNAVGGSAAGNIYGGGGQAAMISIGFFGNAGGAGARGTAWFRAYT